ncbi:unnamed protein product, partial [Amoebophrya sp. A25]|eukprot:GSA25T00017061001.1
MKIDLRSTRTNAAVKNDLNFTVSRAVLHVSTCGESDHIQKIYDVNGHLLVMLDIPVICYTCISMMFKSFDRDENDAP